MSVAVDLDACDGLDDVDDDAAEAACDRELVARGGLAEFVRLAWPLVEKSAELQWNWHLDAVCAELEELARGDAAPQDLVINIPPGMSKSIIVSVLFPAWVWTWDPGHRFIVGSYSDKVVLRDAEKMRSLVKSAWYRARWPAVEIPTGKAQSDAVSVFRTTRGGMRFSTTIPGGQLTGEHCDTMLIDDPINPFAALSASGVEIEAVVTWHRKVARTRFRNHRRRKRACVMQRVHAKDLAGVMIGEGARTLCLPMRFRASHPHRSPRDPRTTDGELLDPARFPDDVVRDLEIALGPSGAAAQLDQSPTTEGGNIFKEAWWKYWTELPAGGTFAISLDCAFKDKATSSYVVMQCWYQVGANFYLVDQEREHLDFSATLARFKAFCGRWPKAFKKYIESKANGPAIVSVINGEIPGLEEVEPEGSKEARAHAVSPLVSAGNVFLPDPEHARYVTANPTDGRVGAPWVVEHFRPEAEGFPKHGTDDQVDAMTQYLNKAAPRLGERLRRAVEGAARTAPAGR